MLCCSELIAASSRHIAGEERVPWPETKTGGPGALCGHVPTSTGAPLGSGRGKLHTTTSQNIGSTPAFHGRHPPTAASSEDESTVVCGCGWARRRLQC